MGHIYTVRNFQKNLNFENPKSSIINPMWTRVNVIINRHNIILSQDELCLCKNMNNSMHTNIESMKTQIQAI